MCFSCWLDYGAPRLETPGVLAALTALRALEERGTAGAAHVVVDDWNIEDDLVAAGVEHAIVQEDFAALAALRALAPLSIEERASALAIVEGFDLPCPACNGTGFRKTCGHGAWACPCAESPCEECSDA